MLRTGKEHLELLRDGRVVYIGSERVDDVTRHPAFRNAAATVAALYDMKADPANREAMSYEEDGGRHSIYFLRPRTREDLQRRMLGHRRIADHGRRWHVRPRRIQPQDDRVEARRRSDGRHVRRDNLTDRKMRQRQRARCAQLGRHAGQVSTSRVRRTDRTLRPW